MENLTIIIEGVNINNHASLNEIAGIAGYAGSPVRLIDECTREITLGTPAERATAGISDAEINAMLVAFVAAGFKISSRVHG